MSKYSMFIGRWQPWHEGHRWLIDQRLNEGKNILILNLSEELKDILNKIKIIKIPDIESINYGRGVGYEVIEHIPPQDIKEISATKIRSKMRKDGKL